jgi:hypothetical protein
VAYRSGTRAAWLTRTEYRMLLSNPAARNALGVNETEEP